MIELDLEAGAALGAASAIALEHELADLARNVLAAHRGPTVVLRKSCVSAVQFALRAPLTVTDQRQHVARRQTLVLPEEALLEDPVGP